MTERKKIITRIENLIRKSGVKRRGERSNRDRAAAQLLRDFRILMGIDETEEPSNPDWEECSYCNKPKPNAKQERISAGVYAGKMCDDCAYSRYRDHCGIDGTPQLTQADLSEDLEPDDYCGSSGDLADYG